MIKYPFEVKYSNIGNNIKIAYCDEGQGAQTLLFIHGLANYIPVFKHNIQGLKDTYRCVAIDLPGNGLSSRDDYPFSIFFYAETLARFIMQENLSNVVLVGHSMGGHVSMVVSLRYPALVQKMVLLAPSGLEYFTETEASLMKTMMGIGSIMYGDAAGLESAINNSYYHSHKKDASHIIKDLLQLMKGEEGKYWRKMVQSNIEAMLNEQVYPFLSQIQHPTLILFGQNDAFIPNKVMHFTESLNSICNKVVKLMPAAQFEIIPHSGHFLQIESAPAVNERIKNFLKD